MTKADLRRELKQLRAAVEARTGYRERSCAVECFRRGEFGETRPTGIYDTRPDGEQSAIIVYEDDETRETLLEQFRRPDGGMPMVICLHE